MVPRRLAHRLRAGLVWLAACAASPAVGDVADLAKRVPPDSNTLIAIDARALRTTPFAAKSTSSPGGDMLRDTFNLPPNVEAAVLASRINFPDWSDVDRVAVLEIGTAPSLEAIAAKERGYVEQIAGFPAAWLPRNIVVSEITRRVYGGMYPARRQAFTRWMSRQREIKGDGPSPYLLQAVGAIGTRTPMVLALDLAGTVALPEAAASLRENPVLQGKTVDRDAIARVLASVRGFTMKLRVTDALEAEARVEFDQPVRPLGDLAKPLLLSYLDDFGADPTGVEGWAAKLEDKAVVFTGPMTTRQVRRILSILEFPSQAMSAPADELPAKGEATQAEIAAASKRYFDAVKGIEDELDAMKGALRGRTRQSQALWYDRFAEKVDQLPVLDTDPDLLAFGSDLSQAYRSIGYRLRGVNLAYGNRRSMGYANAATADAIGRQEATSAQDFTNVTLAQIEQATGEIRRKLTQKYRVEF